jgi:hypothetical protein
VLERVPGVSIEQTYSPVTAPADKAPNLFYKRWMNAGVWGAWQGYGRIRMDTTAGRAAYLWESTNNRDQLIYGDTGRRDISSMCTGSFTGGKLSLRREGSYVELYAINWVAGATGTINMLASALPVGFRPTNSRLMWGYQGGNPVSLSVGYDGTTLTVQSNSATSTVAFSVGYSTSDVWPTSLPGIADGAIPTA